MSLFFGHREVKDVLGRNREEKIEEETGESRKLHEDLHNHMTYVTYYRREYLKENVICGACGNHEGCEK
jgi:hypothetical protein